MSNSTNHFKELRCPCCKSELQISEQTIDCSSCAQVFGWLGNIPDLRVDRRDYYFNPIPRQTMDEMCHNLTKENWAKSIRQFVGLTGDNPDWIDNLVTDGRYAWKFLLSMPTNARVLDIGCGLGNLSKNLAPHGSTVWATDLTVERLLFSQKRFSIFNQNDDIALCASGDGTYLPFPDGHFDCAILSGVLEWIGTGDTSTFVEGSYFSRLMKMLYAHFGKSNPREIQRAFLKEIVRVLKPDGQLFIGIENRLNIDYFGNRRDHHSGLWFGSLLPRFFATLYSIAINRSPYRTYTYSIPGYRKLLNSAGLNSTRFYGLFDGYSKLNKITPLEISNGRWIKKTPEGFLENLRNNRFFVPAYGIVATKNKIDQSKNKIDQCYLDRILSEIEQTLQNKITFDSFTVTGKDKAILLAWLEKLPVVIKLPLNTASSVGEANNAETLESLHSEDSVAVSHWIPESLAHGCVQKQKYFVESRQAGISAAHQPDKNSLQNILSVVQPYFDWVMNSSIHESFDNDFYNAFVTAPIESLAPLIADGNITKRLGEYFEQHLRSTSLGKGLMHGDFSYNNLFILDGKLSGIIDWESSRRHGLPVLDLLNIIESSLRHRNNHVSLFETISAMAEDKGGTFELDSGGVFKLLAPFDVEKTMVKPLVYLYWLNHTASQVPFQLQYNKKQIQHIVQPVAEQILQSQ